MITIVGAGLGGLTLARVLDVHGVESVVYDAASSPSVRHLGGMLDLREESGRMALRAAGLFEEFERAAREGAGATRIVDMRGTVLLDDPGHGDRPEIQRGTLRDLLLYGLPEGTVTWGARVTDVRITDGGHELVFADGRTAKASVLVGADGAWSVVRPLLSRDRPVYSGLAFTEIRVRDVEAEHSRLAGLVGAGSLYALDEERGLLAHREPGDELCAYAVVKKPSSWTGSEISRAELLEEFPGWHEDLRALIAETRGELIPCPIHALPVGHRWVRVAGVTLVGDAAHLMAPFAGQGANLAMQDGAELAQAFIAHPGDPEAAMGAYEAAMFPRARTAAEQAAANLDELFDPGASRRLAGDVA